MEGGETKNGYWCNECEKWDEGTYLMLAGGGRYCAKCFSEGRIKKLESKEREEDGREPTE